MRAATVSSRLRRLVTVAIFFALAYAWGPTAAAQLPECPLDLLCLDPDVETPSPVPTPGEDPVGTIEETVGTIEETVGGVGETTEETVDKVAEEVTGTAEAVEETVPGGSAAPPPKDPPTGRPAAGGGPVAPRTEGMLAREIALGLGAPVALTDAEVDGSAIPTRPASGSSAVGTGSSEGVAEVVTEIARRIAFPLALALILGGFLVVQNRLDRRDPKLALAPIDTDLLDFE